MYQLTLEEFTALVNGLPYGIIVFKKLDKTLESIIVAFANKTAELVAKYKLEDIIGKTIVELSPTKSISKEFADAWNKLSHTDNPAAVAKLDFGEVASDAGVYDITMYSIGDGCVVMTYKKVTKYEAIQDKINIIQEKLKMATDTVPVDSSTTVPGPIEPTKKP